MSSAPPQASQHGRSRMALPASAVFLVSMAVLGLELALMRCFSVASWHHFSYLVISTALLGFGASGTLLTLLGRRLQARFDAWAVALTLALALSVPLCFRAAQALPLDPQYILYSRRQGLLMAAYHLAFFVPFLLGALVIGLSLMHYAERVHVLYGANMLGSGAGSLAMILLMFVLPEAALLNAVAALALLAAAAWAAHAAGGRRAWGVVLGLCVAAAAAALVLLGAVRPLKLRIDQYKMLAVARRWAAQGDAEHLLTRHSPRGRLDVYSSPRFHLTLFAGLGAPGPPPPQLMLLLDGHLAGGMFQIRSAADARILDHTPMSVPYRMLKARDVLLLGERDGTNVWLARRAKAERITVVQRHARLIETLRGPLRNRGGGVFALPGVEVVTADLRLFLEATQGRYDIIHLAQAESMAAGTSGLLSLHEDYLLTRQGLALCLRRLRPGGLLAVTRGMQSPPRDNVKILATLVEALESLGVARPGRHVAQLRNYLAATTLASLTPLAGGRCERLISASRELGLDVEWAPCPGVDPTDQRATVPGPPGAAYSYYHYAAREILSPRREAFFRNWLYNVRPATDDSPYFHNFFRWSALGALRRSYGRLWFRKLDLGYVVVAAALAQVVVAGAVLIVLPLLWLRGRSSRRGGRLSTLAYFLLLGAAYMLLEMVLILKFTQFLGDPVLAAGGVLSAFLVCSGLGSMASGRISPSPPRTVSVGAVGIMAAAIGLVLGLDVVFALGASWHTAGRFVLCVCIAGPVAFVMGWPFPSGLGMVRRGAPGLMPWAWAANGFASVAGPPAAVLIAVSSGFSAVILLGAVLYGCAGLVAWKLPGARRSASA